MSDTPEQLPVEEREGIDQNPDLDPNLDPDLGRKGDDPEVDNTLPGEVPEDPNVYPDADNPERTP